MKHGYTHISVILDRTGSMEVIRDDTIGGFNAFLKEQKAQPGTATLTLTQFDSQDPYEVLCSFKPISEVKELTRETYIPRACTPLLDAMGRGIIDLESRISRMKKSERPSRVVFTVVTDGQENASREFSKQQIVEMIGKHQDNDGWQFVFLSSDLDSIDDAMAYGVLQDRSLRLAKSGRGMRQAWTSVSSRVAELREGVTDSLAFTVHDRAAQERLIREEEGKADNA